MDSCCTAISSLLLTPSNAHSSWPNCEINPKRTIVYHNSLSLGWIWWPSRVYWTWMPLNLRGYFEFFLLKCYLPQKSNIRSVCLLSCKIIYYRFQMNHVLTSNEVVILSVDWFCILAKPLIMTKDMKNTILPTSIQIHSGFKESWNIHWCYTVLLTFF